MCLKVSRPHYIPNIRYQLLFVDTSKEDFRFVTYFVCYEIVFILFGLNLDLLFII